MARKFFSRPFKKLKDFIGRHRRQPSPVATLEATGPLNDRSPSIQSHNAALLLHSEPSTDLTDVRGAGNRDTLPDAETQSESASKDNLSGEIQSTDGNEDTSHFPSITQLWDDAYDELLATDDTQELMKKYEFVLRKAADAHNVNYMTKRREERRHLMQEIAGKKSKEVEDGEWKVSFKGHDFAVKDIVVPIASILGWSKDYISSALEASPPASIAWAGIFLLLQPLLLNPAQQDASRIKGLDQIARIIRECSIREAIYQSRYGPMSSAKPGSRSTHTEYRRVIQSLYSKIITFQVTYICFLDGNTAKRWTQDTVNWQGWDELVREISDQNTSLKSMDEHWRDLFQQEESELQERRHEQSLANSSMLQQEIQRFRSLVKDAQSENDRLVLLQWLKGADPSFYHNRAIPKHKQKDTGKWLLESDELQEWMRTPNSFLWLQGKAGAGKSVLSSTVIENLENNHANDPYTALAYFYISFQGDSTQSRSNILKSFITQLAGRRPDTPKALLDLKTYRDRNLTPPLAKLEDAFRSVSKDFTTTYLIIDGLDECPLANTAPPGNSYPEPLKDSRREILDFLMVIQSWNFECLHIFVTSRPEYDIQISLRPIVEQQQARIVDLATMSRAQKVMHDISLHIDNEFQKPVFTYLGNALKKEVKEALMSKANGVFYYVSLQLEAFTFTMSENKVRSILSSLPDGLYDMYDRALLSLSPIDRAKAKRALIWVSFSQVPLTVQELSIAVLLDEPKDEFLPDTIGRPNNANLLPPIFEKNDSFLDPLGVLHLLAGLFDLQSGPEVTRIQSGADKSQDIVLLAHFTLLEYLTSDDVKTRPASSFGLSKQEAHIYMAQACLQYFIHAIQKEPHQDGDKLRHDYALLNYAACHGLRHADAISHNMWPLSLQRLVRYILHDDDKLFKMLKSISNLPARQIDDSPLHYVVENRLSEALSFFSKEFRATVDQRDENGESATFRASRNGYLDMLSGLFEYNPDLNLATRNGVVALQVAAARGHEDVTECLRQHDANVGVVTAHGETILHLAVFSEDENMVQWAIKQSLDKQSLDINAVSNDGETALHRAVKIGNEIILDLLLSADNVDINVRSREGETPLLYAARLHQRKTRTQILEVLLKHKADVNIANYAGETALYWVARNIGNN